MAGPRWVPPEMARMGMTPRMMDVLVDTARKPIERTLPGPQMSVVYDRDGYMPLMRERLIKLHHIRAGVASLGDYFVLTPAGRSVLRLYREQCALVGVPKTREHGSRLRRPKNPRKTPKQTRHGATLRLRRYLRAQGMTTRDIDREVNRLMSYRWARFERSR